MVTRYATYLADLDHRRTRSHGIVNAANGYVHSMAPLLADDEELIAIVSEDSQEADDIRRAGIEVRTVKTGVGPSRLLTETALMLGKGPASDCQLLHFPKGFVPPWTSPKIPLVVTTHDDFPSQYLRGDYGPNGRNARNTFFHQSFERAKKVATAMTTSSPTVLSNGSAEGDRPRFIGLPIEFDIEPSPDADRSDAVLLFVSDLPHKATTSQLALYDWTAKRHGLEVWAVAGSEHVGRIPTRWEVFETPQPASEIDRLQRQCRVLLFPSMYEGFGMPPVEAVLRGTPVVRADRPAMSTTLDGLPGAFLDWTPESLDNAFSAALSTTSDELAACQSKLVDLCEPRAVGQRLLDVFREVLENGELR